VSPKWCFLIENKIGISLVLGDNEENREVADISRITEIGVAKCKIMSTYIRPQHLLIPQFKSPNLLRTLKIYNGFLYQCEFQNLVAGARNLHTLTLSSRTYSNFYNVSNLQTFELPNLRRLILGKRREENSLTALGFDYPNICTGFGLADILRIFAVSSVPRLKELTLCASAIYIWDVALLTKQFLSFLMQQAQSIRDLDVSFLHVDHRQPLGRVGNEGRTVIEAEIEVTLSHLEELHLNTFDLELSPNEEAINWTHFIETSEKVANKVKSLTRREMAYPSYRETLYFTQFIQNNQATLTQLSLPVSDFDCALLTQCVNLKALVLHGKRKTREGFETENFRGVPAKPEVNQLALLPKSLEQILISSLFVTSTEIATINFDNFPKLKRLFVFEIGEKEDLGLTLKDFSTLMGTIFGDKEMVFCLEISGGINRRSVLEQTMP